MSFSENLILEISKLKGEIVELDGVLNDKRDLLQYKIKQLEAIKGFSELDEETKKQILDELK